MANTGAADFYITSGDRLPEIQHTLTDASGSAVDLTGSTVVFALKNDAGTEQTFNATLVTPSSGIVKYSWAAGDVGTTLAVGYWYGRWRVTFSSGKVAEYPNDGPFTVLIDD